MALPRTGPKHVEPCAKHCPHPTGHSSSWGSAGSDGVICCRCGVGGNQLWHVEQRQVKGHGPHAFENVKVKGETKWNR